MGPPDPGWHHHVGGDGGPELTIAIDKSGPNINTSPG